MVLYKISGKPKKFSNNSIPYDGIFHDKLLTFELLFWQVSSQAQVNR